MTPDNDNGLELAIAIENLRFAWGAGMAPVLKIERLQVPRGERLFIEGPSGSGKSTLLSLVAGVVIPQEGRIRVHGQLLNTMPGAARDRFRADQIGYIYQMFNLIPYLSIVENVTLPCRFSKIRRERAAGRNGNLMAEATRLLKKLGLEARSFGNRSVTDLSVGQQQRVAAARALIGTPAIIIADEPTSALDAQHREAFIRLLFQECDQEKTTLVFVSHDTSLAGMFDHRVQLTDINAI
jgi:putative ABC transport system ATP-binding protein